MVHQFQLDDHSKQKHLPMYTANTLLPSNRIQYIDFTKGIAIFLVCLGHSTQYLDIDNYWNNPIWKFIYSFHMPLFMILCGFFFKSSINLSFKELISKKTVQLIIPTITFFFTFDTLLLFKNLNDFIPLSDNLIRYLDVYIYNFWFLKCVFVCYIIAYCARRYFHNDDILSAITSIIIVTLIPCFNTYYISFMLPFFWIGYFFSKYQKQIDKSSSYILPISLILFSILLIKWNGNYTIYHTPISLIQSEAPFINIHNFNITSYRFIIGISGSSCVILLAKKIVHKFKNKLITFISLIGASTLGIYVLQVYTLEFLLPRLHLHVTPILTPIYAIVITIVEVLFCWKLVLLIRKNSFLKYILLGEYKP